MRLTRQNMIKKLRTVRSLGQMAVLGLVVAELVRFIAAAALTFSQAYRFESWLRPTNHSTACHTRVIQSATALFVRWFIEVRTLWTMLRRRTVSLGSHPKVFACVCVQLTLCQTVHPRCRVCAGSSSPMAVSGSDRLADGNPTSDQQQQTVRDSCNKHSGVQSAVSRGRE